jgi:TetR/AcrR family transcriptional regulator, regulator of cefoperazone and chloramphenicol sensitivity
MADEGGKKGALAKRQRLLEAAGEVFAQRSYRAATIREISQRANANIASVNYHFRDKESLYHEVFLYALSQARSRYVAYPLDVTEARPARRFRRELRRYLKTNFSADREPWQAMIFFREMFEPTDVFETLVEENLKPYQEYLESLVREVVGPRVDEHSVRFSAFATMAISCYFHNVEQYIKKIYPEERFSGESSDELADLIARFVLGGIGALKLPSK